MVLDLVYEARDIDQRLSSQQKVDVWFAAKTKGLNPVFDSCRFTESIKCYNINVLHVFSKMA